MWITEKEYDEAMNKDLIQLKETIHKRMSQGLSLFAIAKQTGLRWSTVKDFITGKHLPSFKTVSRIRTYLSVSDGKSV